MAYFMIIGFKTNIPYVIKDCPENLINAEWLKDQLMDSLKTLQTNNFYVRGIVCDNVMSLQEALSKDCYECR